MASCIPLNIPWLYFFFAYSDKSHVRMSYLVVIIVTAQTHRMICNSVHLPWSYYSLPFLCLTGWEFLGWGSGHRGEVFLRISSCNWECTLRNVLSSYWHVYQGEHSNIIVGGGGGGCCAPPPPPNLQMTVVSYEEPFSSQSVFETVTQVISGWRH